MGIKEKFEGITEKDRSLAVLRLAKHDFEQTSILMDIWRDSLITNGLFIETAALLDLVPNSYFVRHDNYNADNLDLVLVFDRQKETLRRLTFRFPSLDPIDDIYPRRNLVIDAQYVYRDSDNKSIYLTKAKHTIKAGYSVTQSQIKEILADLIISSGYGNGEQSGSKEKSETILPETEKQLAALRLHRLAFDGLTEQQIQKLIERMRKFGAEVFHPDRNGSEDSMKRVNVAADFLMDPRNRRKNGV